ncbi:hypothetical protein AB7M22_001669 [Pseudomonas sp. ADAK2 TE3594]
MNTVEQIVKNEPIEDVIAVFALNSALPSLDRMIRRHRQEGIASGDLLRIYTKLFEDGILARGEGPIAVKGPNWKDPEFVKERKYI